MLRCEKDVFLKNKFFWNPHFPQQYTQIQSYDGDKWQVKYDLSTLFKMTRKPLEKTFWFAKKPYCIKDLLDTNQELVLKKHRQ